MPLLLQVTAVAAFIPASVYAVIRVMEQREGRVTGLVAPALLCTSLTNHLRQYSTDLFGPFDFTDMLDRVFIGVFVTSILIDLYFFEPQKPWLPPTVWSLGASCVALYLMCMRLRSLKSEMFYKVAVCLHGVIHLIAGITALLILLY